MAGLILFLIFGGILLLIIGVARYFRTQLNRDVQRGYATKIMLTGGIMLAAEIIIRSILSVLGGLF